MALIQHSRVHLLIWLHSSSLSGILPSCVCLCCFKKVYVYVWLCVCVPVTNYSASVVCCLLLQFNVAFSVLLLFFPLCLPADSHFAFRLGFKLTVAAHLYTADAYCSGCICNFTRYCKYAACQNNNSNKRS